MTEFHLTVLGEDAQSEKKLVTSLRSALAPLVSVKVDAASETSAWGQILFISERVADLDRLLSGLDRRGKAVFLLMDERTGPMAHDLPMALVDGKVDDVLLHPFRPLEALSKIRHYQTILEWDEVNKVSASFAELLERLHDDLKLAERIQKMKLPVRFPEVRGFKVTSRYLAGMRSGGDHFDLADSQDGNSLSLVLSDSSTYGLSSNVLSVLMRVAMKLSTNEVRSCEDTVKRIHEELALTLGEKDRLSLFYGVISRKDFRLRFLNLGSSMAFYASPTKPFEALGSHSGPITQKSGMPLVTEYETVLEPEGRLVLLSDGFTDAAGGSKGALELLNRFREKEPADLLNELVYQVKSKFTEPDDMPEQDCTAALFDVDARILRRV